MSYVEFDAGEIERALRHLQDSIGDLRPALKKIGIDLTESTKRRFETTTGPDGKQWAANTQATYESFLHQKSGKYEEGARVGAKKGYFLKDGRVSARSASLLSGKKPLTGETGKLMDQIGYDVFGFDTLQIYSTMEYSAMQQFGGEKSEFPWLWGDIPARPFLGISEDDKNNISSIINHHLLGT